MPTAYRQPPDRDQEVAQLISSYRRHGTRRDFERAVESYLPLARRLARRYTRRHGGGFEDLEQAAYLGLVKAVMRFDPARGHAFGAFAVPTIVGEIKRYCRDTGWAVHVPRAVQERVFAIRADADDFACHHARQPTVAELAGRLSYDQEEITEALLAARALSPVSLDACAEADEEDGAAPRADQLGADDPGYEHVDWLAALEQGMERLTPTQLEMVRLRYAEEMTQLQIARRLDLPAQRIPGFLHAALSEIRAAALPAG